MTIYLEVYWLLSFENGEEFGFLSLWCTWLGKVFQARNKFSAAEELYDFSIGSGVGSKHWEAKFHLAVLRTGHMDKWNQAEALIRDAISQGLPDEDTLRRCMKELLRQIKDWEARQDKAGEVKNLKSLATIIYDGMKSQGGAKKPRGLTEVVHSLNSWYW